MSKLKHPIAAVLIILLIGWKLTSGGDEGSSDAYPTHPIHVVVPYTAGGGSDNFARLIGTAIDEKEILPQPFVVLNQPGGSGTIGSRYVKDARPDGYRILCHHESIITAKLSGAVPFGPEAFQPIAQSGNIVLLVIVRKDAPYATIRDLLEAAKKSPDTLRFGANSGSPAHFTAKKLEAEVPGASFNLVTTGGGQKRYISILGGHLDAGIFSLAEYLSYKSEEGTPADKDIRALVVLSGERHPTLPDVPTCVEDNINVTSSNAYYWWAPKGTPQPIVDAFADAIEQAMQDETVLTTLSDWSIGHEYLRDEALMTRIDERVAALQPPTLEAPPNLPNYPLYAAVAVVILIIMVTLQKASEDTDLEDATPRKKNALLCFAMLCVYVLSLQYIGLSYAIATAIMIFVAGGLISNWDRARFVPLIELALLTGLGSEYLFTQIFTVVLP
jgi:tripartite-type tricarboxylate transporter receptor subunit TctC